MGDGTARLRNWLALAMIVAAILFRAYMSRQPAAHGPTSASSSQPAP